MWAGFWLGEARRGGGQRAGQGSKEERERKGRRIEDSKESRGSLKFGMRLRKDETRHGGLVGRSRESCVVDGGLGEI